MKLRSKENKFCFVWKNMLHFSSTGFIQGFFFIFFQELLPDFFHGLFSGFIQQFMTGFLLDCFWDIFLYLPKDFSWVWIPIDNFPKSRRVSKSLNLVEPKEKTKRHYRDFCHNVIWQSFFLFVFYSNIYLLLHSFGIVLYKDQSGCRGKSWIYIEIETNDKMLKTYTEAYFWNNSKDFQVVHENMLFFFKLYWLHWTRA